MVALVLACIRFIVVPWSQSQVEQRQQLEVLTQRLDRSVGVVANAQAIRTAQNKVAEASKAALAPYPVVADRDRFRLDAQRQLAAIAGRGGAKVVLFDWVLDGEAESAGLSYGRVNASLAGPIDRLVAVHGQVEGEMPFAMVREVKVDFGREGVGGLSDRPATLGLVVDLYYRPATREGGQ